MRASTIASLVVITGLAAAPAFGATTSAPQPYDGPAAPDGVAVVPIANPTEAELLAPRAVPQATDDERPRRAPRSVLLVPAPPPVAPQTFDPDPSEPGRIMAESVLAFFAADVATVMGAVSGGWPILAAPLVTGGVVCAIGSGSDDFDGSCAAAIGGAYLGSLVAIPMAFLFSGQGSSSEDGLPPALVGALLGLVLGSTAGAVVGWNVSREPRLHRDADVAHLDALSSSRALPWTEPLRARGVLAAAAEPRLSVPLLAFRF